MWFDGFYLHGNPHPGRPGCVCEFCRKRYKNETGYELPDQIDWTDMNFKRWVRWRNEKLVEAAGFIKDEIQSVRPDIPVIYNYNAWPFGNKDWETGIPLWKTSEYGISQHAYFGGNLRWIMLGYKAQLSHDLNPENSDIWRVGFPTFDSTGTEEDRKIHETDLKLFLLAGLTYGTLPWRSYHDNGEIRLKNNEYLLHCENYFSTQKVRFAGVFISQNTHDFWGHEPQTENLFHYRDSILGSWLLLSENHIQFEFIFDNQIEANDLAGFEVILLPNAVCMSEKQVHVLKEWVIKGGTLIVTEDTAKCNEWGEKLPQAGIDIFNGAANDQESKGKVYHIEKDPGLQYIRYRDMQSAYELLDMIHEVESPIEIIAPKSVVTNSFYAPDKNEIWIHLLNVSFYYTEDNDCGFYGLKQEIDNVKISASDAEQAQSKKITQYRNAIHPARDIVIKVNNEKYKSAVRALTGQVLLINSNNEISIPEVDCHEIIILKEVSS